MYNCLESKTACFFFSFTSHLVQYYNHLINQMIRFLLYDYNIAFKFYLQVAWWHSEYCCCLICWIADSEWLNYGSLSSLYFCLSHSVPGPRSNPNKNYYYYFFFFLFFLLHILCYIPDSLVSQYHDLCWRYVRHKHRSRWTGLLLGETTQEDSLET